MTVDIKALRELEAKATPGPWEVEVDPDLSRIGPWSGRRYDPYEGGLPIVDKALFFVGRKDKALLEDLYLIVAMRNALPELLDELERMRAKPVVVCPPLHFGCDECGRCRACGESGWGRP